jgi:DNA-directed RNA polymerase specialized sigma subunit
MQQSIEGDQSTFPEVDMSKLTTIQQREIERLIPLAKRLAKRYAKHEAEGEAFMALCLAVPEYDASRGTTLDAWAKMMVTNAQLSELEGRGAIRRGSCSV